MQVTQENNRLNINLDTGYGYNQNSIPTSRKKKALSCLSGVLVFVLIISSTFYLIFNYVDLNYLQQARDFVLGKIDEQNLVEDENKARTFNEANLSYFSDNEIAKLGILSLPENFSIQEVYKGIRFVRSPKQKFSDIQLTLLKNFVDMTPQKLLNPGPTAIVTYAKGEIKTGTNVNERTSAFASGSYVFFNDQSFNPIFPLADNSVDAAFGTFIHELTHVAQFNEISMKLNKKNIDESYNSGLSWIDLVMRSTMTTDFALNNGWEIVTQGEKVDYKLPNPDLVQTSEYGKTHIHEDIAESIAATVTTNISGFSQSRITWSQRYLEEMISDLKVYKFPFPANMDSVTASNLQFDTNKENEIKLKYTYTNRQVFITGKTNSISSIQTFMKSELLARGWVGSFTKIVEKDNVIRFKGNFDGVYRDMYIEIYSYDQAKGYLVKPEGTIMVVISGYIPK